MELKTFEPEALESFREATMELDNTYSTFSKACGLTDNEYWSLLLIYEGVVTQSKISERLFLSRQTLNSAFKQLVKKGLVCLEAYEENQRTKQAFLTDNGIQFVEKHIVHMHQIEEKAWEMMSKEECATLTRLTRKYNSLVQELLVSPLPKDKTK